MFSIASYVITTLLTANQYDLPCFAICVWLDSQYNADFTLLGDLMPYLTAVILGLGVGDMTYFWGDIDTYKSKITKKNLSMNCYIPFISTFQEIFQNGY